MNIHEYQAKEVLRKFGVAVPRGIPAFSVEEAVKAADDLGGPIWVVKAPDSCRGTRQSRWRQNR